MSPEPDSMFRPPINRAMRTLDRSFFKQRIPISAARIYDNKNISKYRAALEKSKDVLEVERIITIRPDPVAAYANNNGKCLLLKPEIKHDDSSTWSAKLRDSVKAEEVGVVPYELELDYKYWTYHDIISAILPENELGEIPSGFSVVGHVAHLNLRDQYLPYKHLIAEIIMDKNPNIETVINKIDDVGEESEYRTFNYELLAGSGNMNVEIKEEDCIFHFNYAKVYWNSRLNTEHRRLVALFKEGDAAGIGPFAVPAGKKGVFVWANDLNPDSYTSLEDAIKRNKVERYVRPFNENGHNFIRTATASLFHTHHTVRIFAKRPRGAAKFDLRTTTPDRVLTQPRVFNHYVMNLPASAIAFLPSFIGLYANVDRSLLTNPEDSLQMPLIHVYTFSTKSEDNVGPSIQICKEISKQLELEADEEITPQTPETAVWDVRDVAPNKRMFCATFRLPASVAFRSGSERHASP
ncbi:Met-10+ like-protein-domain-containing protein [Cryomyces antarcticus]